METSPLTHPYSHLLSFRLTIGFTDKNAVSATCFRLQNYIFFQYQTQTPEKKFDVLFYLWNEDCCLKNIMTWEVGF